MGWHHPLLVGLFHWEFNIVEFAGWLWCLRGQRLDSWDRKTALHYGTRDGIYPDLFMPSFRIQLLHMPGKKWEQGTLFF